ncbi:MAG: EVE domain-containing protein [Asticcacaulis sp.]|uniref:EVE domain-containing protein n=1 Tax=Asticcacaulis sp. TaxID=1872648 RepID=UPI0039E5AEFE
MTRFWLAVACAEHVRRGRAEGFMQVNHGKLGPLKRMKAGDGVVYYSPSEKMGAKDGFQSFTAIGRIREGEPYQGFMSEGFQPFRRDVEWTEGRERPIRPLMGALDLTRDKNWGYSLRFGLLELSAEDFATIGATMTSSG